MADDPVAQVLAQNALIADALYDLVQFIDGMTLDAREAAILQDAKTKVNALNPSRFTFGQPSPVQRQRTMYDAVTPSAIPADAEVVAGYVDGRYAWSEADWARFPNAAKVRIAVFSTTNDGDVLDCEPGDARPEDCAAWVAMRQAAGVARPVIYCSRSSWPAVLAACGHLDVGYWIADWTGQAHLLDGAVATQWIDPNAGSGGAFDVSLCRAGWPA